MGRPLRPLGLVQNTYIMVKWNNEVSSQITVNGGGPQGGTAGGILEYISQTAHNLSFLPPDEACKFIDDATTVEILNLFMAGLSSFNCKAQVPSDIATEDYFLSNQHFKTQDYLNTICYWTNEKQMKLNCQKTKYI